MVAVDVWGVQKGGDGTQEAGQWCRGSCGTKDPAKKTSARQRTVDKSVKSYLTFPANLTFIHLPSCVNTINVRQ